VVYPQAVDRRPVLVGTVLAALVGAVVSGVVAAAPTSGGVTIIATPNPIFTGDAVLIFGRLKTAHPGGKKIVLHERIDPAVAFTTAQTTVTNTTGYYDFTESGGVSTDRSWFVSSPAGGSTHSRTVHEVVASAVTLASSAAAGETNHPLTFTGRVTPAGVHAGESVALQKQIGTTGGTWKTIAKGTIDSGSNYSISRTFLLPGAFDLRVRLAGDKQNSTGLSDPLTAVVEQTENASFAIGTTAPIIVIGQSTTISGRLYAQSSAGTPLAGTSVTLWGHEAGASYAPITSTKTGPDGSYSFPQTPTHNETYEVRTTFTPPARRRTAQLFEGVADQTTISASATSSTVGATVTLTGTVTPDKAGRTVDLEQLGADGHYEVAKTGLVGPSSAYQFAWTFGAAGTKTFRVVVPGGPDNVKGVSPAVAITVALPPVQSLPAP
jgi:hypothetical protein